MSHTYSAKKISVSYFSCLQIRLTKRRASESVFGYITLLPSGYRSIVLHKKNSVGESPLQKYVLARRRFVPS